VQPMDSMRSWLAASIAVHALILALIIFGLPYFHPKPKDMPPMISVELVPVGKETTTNKVSDANKVKEHPEEEQPAPPTPPPPQAEQPPKQEPQPTPPQPKLEPQPAPKLPDVAAEVPDLKTPDFTVKPQFKDMPKLAEVDTTAPALVVPPKVDFTKKVPPKPQVDPFQAVLKNLTKDPPKPLTDAPPEPRAKTPPTERTGAQAPVSANLTASEMDAVRQQLNGCMNWPAADKDLRDLQFDVELTINPDRTVASARIVDQGRMNDPLFAAAARAALRAVRMAQCTPLDLPPDKYQSWQDMTVTFSPPRG
jgi:hypothetical protein